MLRSAPLPEAALIRGDACSCSLVGVQDLTTATTATTGLLGYEAIAGSAETRLRLMLLSDAGSKGPSTMLIAKSLLNCFGFVHPYEKPFVAGHCCQTRDCCFIFASANHAEGGMRFAAVLAIVVKDLAALIGS